MPNFLVVEDSPIMRKVIAHALKGIKDAHVVEAADGVDGLKKMLVGRFDLILIDINMPLMDGLKLVYLVRKSAAMKDIPIVFVTTEGSEVDRDRGMRLGANAYITKPIYGPRLREVVLKLLAENSKQGVAEESASA